MKNIFTVDLEDWYHGNFIDKSDRPGLFRSERLVKQTNKILYLLEKTKNKATFFVLGADAITGTRKGIGRSLIEYYANKGFLVIGCSRRNVDFESDNYRHFSLDVCNEKNVNKMFSEIRKVYGRLDILINNAGIASMNPVLLTPLKKKLKIY